MTKEVVMDFDKKPRRKRVRAVFKRGDIVRPRIAGGPAMWVECERNGRATVWFFENGHFINARLPAGYLKKVGEA